MKLLLASASPRRRELLLQVGIEFEVAPQDIDESVLEGEAPAAYVERLALAKAANASPKPGQTVLAADTTVVANDCILGKPADRSDAIAMLTQLAGRRHRVLSGIAARRGQRTASCVVAADVWLAPLTSAIIERYVDTGEPYDKAGSYGVQGIAGAFVTRVEGSYSAVVGLPLAETETLLSEVGFDTWRNR